VVRFATFADDLTVFFQFGAPDIVADGLMGRGLGGEDEVAADAVDGRDDRLAGKQSSPR